MFNKQGGQLTEYKRKTFYTSGVILFPIDAQDLGISIELLPLSRPDEDFNVSLFYVDLIGLEGDELAQFMPLAVERFVFGLQFLMDLSFGSKLICLLVCSSATFTFGVPWDLGQWAKLGFICIIKDDENDDDVQER
ncbi:ATP-dependent DNA helicase 2 subunit KU70 isoform X1 [Tanacetum coccineum]